MPVVFVLQSILISQETSFDLLFLFLLVPFNEDLNFVSDSDAEKKKRKKKKSKRGRGPSSSQDSASESDESALKRRKKVDVPKKVSYVSLCEEVSTQCSNQLFFCAALDCYYGITGGGWPALVFLNQPIAKFNLPYAIQCF